MRGVGRPALPLGAHGKIAIRPTGSGRFRASTRLRTWDGETCLVAAVCGAAPDARALLDVRIEEKLRLSELDIWRYLTAADPFGELVYCWLDGLRTFTSTPETTCARYERVLREQVAPAFGHLTIGEISAERIEHHLAQRSATSEEAANASREVLRLLMDFAVHERVIAANPAICAVQANGVILNERTEDS